MQTPWQSAVEKLVDLAIGSVGAGILTYIAIRVSANPEAAATMSVVLCTGWSFIRGYFVRRFFARRGQ